MGFPRPKKIKCKTLAGNRDSISPLPFGYNGAVEQLQATLVLIMLSVSPTPQHPRSF